jgi:hypothetical protein
MKEPPNPITVASQKEKNPTTLDGFGVLMKETTHKEAAFKAKFKAKQVLSVCFGVF